VREGGGEEREREDDLVVNSIELKYVIMKIDYG
jgi:hypothetical protein